MKTGRIEWEIVKRFFSRECGCWMVLAWNPFFGIAVLPAMMAEL